MDLASFSLFSLLPPEIRILIWEYSMTPSTVYTKPLGNKFISNPRKQANPSLLQVNHESRSIALTHYELARDIDRTYVNFGLDTIYIDCIDCLDLNILTLLPSRSENRFQFLAVDWEWICMYGLDFVVEKVSRCQSLRRLTIMVKSTESINKGYESELSPSIAKYIAMTEQEASDHLAKQVCNGYNALTFDEKCEFISWGWADQVNHRFHNRKEWPEVYVASQAVAVVSSANV
jgi:hypothetical protein